MTTCPRCGSDTTGQETCQDCGRAVDAVADGTLVETAVPESEVDPGAEAEADPAAEPDVLVVGPETADETTPTGDPKPSRWRRPVVVAAAVGVIGLLVGGAVGFGASQLADGDDGSSASATAAKLSLPSTLSGGYKRDTSVDTQILASVTSARSTLGAGTDMALYAQDQTQVLVEATRLPGDAVLNAGMSYTKVGKAVCSTSSSSSGSEAICVRTNDDLTVKVTATDAKTAAKYVEEVYLALA